MKLLIAETPTLLENSKFCFFPTAAHNFTLFVGHQPPVTINPRVRTQAPRHAKQLVSPGDDNTIKIWLLPGTNKRQSCTREISFNFSDASAYGCEHPLKASREKASQDVCFTVKFQHPKPTGEAEQSSKNRKMKSDKLNFFL